MGQRCADPSEPEGGLEVRVLGQIPAAVEKLDRLDAAGQAGGEVMPEQRALAPTGVDRERPGVVGQCALEVIGRDEKLVRVAEVPRADALVMVERRLELPRNSRTSYPERPLKAISPIRGEALVSSQFRLVAGAGSE